MEFDDFHWAEEVNCIDIVEHLIKRYPPIIINMFVPPNYLGRQLSANESWCKRVLGMIDGGNLNLAVHGLCHYQEEYKFKRYNEVRSDLTLIDKYFRDAEFPYQKVFRGPHWGLNEDTFRALIDCGYTHVYSHKNYEDLNNKFKDQIKIVYYNWNLKDNYGILENELETNIMVAHGHTSNVCGNGIQESLKRICNVFDSTSFEFLKVGDY